MTELLPLMKGGIPELNIPPMDPLVIERAAFHYDNGAIKARVALKNLKTIGISSTIMDKVEFKQNGKDVQIELKSHVKKLKIEGVYKADIKMNDVKMLPKGVFNVTLSRLIKIFFLIKNV